MKDWLRDLRYGLRLLRRSPGFAAAAILTLALGIGANTAIFSLLDAALLRPLPFRQPGQLVQLWENMGFPGPFAGPDFRDWQRLNHSLAGMTLYSFNQDYNLNGGTQPLHVVGTATEANFFTLLGAMPLMGRTWAASEDQPGRTHEAILSYGLWQGRFAGRRTILNHAIELNGRAYRVIGIMPRNFDFPRGAELWTPENMSPSKLGQRGEHQWLALGRLKPGMAAQPAQANLATLAARLTKLYPGSNTGVSATVTPLKRQLTRGLRTQLWIMQAAALLVLLIACVNLANLLLGRALARRREMAIRSALGAGRARLLRQLLIESLALALAGCAAGVLLGELGIRLLAELPNLTTTLLNPVKLNATALGFALALALLTAMLFGIAPAWQLARAEAAEEFKGGAGSRLSPSRHRQRLSQTLVAGEVALSLMLLATAGLLLVSFYRLAHTPIGVRRHHVLTAQVNLPAKQYATPDARLSFARAWLARVRALPGVRQAAISDHLPLEGGTNGTITMYGQPTNNNSASQLVEMHGITRGYFRTLGIPLIAGRRLNESDSARALAIDRQLTPYYQASKNPPAGLTRGMEYPTLINQAMARHFWPGQDPLGKKFSFDGADGPWWQVVGMVGNVRQWGITHPPLPEEFQPFDGANFGGTHLLAYGKLPAASLAPELRHALAQVNAGLPLYRLLTIRQLIARHDSNARGESQLLGLFAALAALLAGIGLYGVMNYAVSRRAHELGVRMALGADPARLERMVLAQALRLAGLGAIAGLAATLSLGRLLASQLYGVQADNAAVLATTTALLLLIAVAAGYIPARRAAAVDPATALRSE